MVEQDETEQGVRAILNLGHTFGHAYEALTRYKKFVHGEAVAIGMVSAARVAVKTGLMGEKECLRIEKLVETYGLPRKFGSLDIKEIIAGMNYDKKVIDGKVRYVLPDTIGTVRIVSEIPPEILEDVLKEQQGI